MGNRQLCDNHRGISLLNIAGKIFARILRNRLNGHLEQGLLPESQCGFLRHCGTTNMIFAARQLREKCQEMQTHLYTIFVDLTTAFNTVNRDGLWKVMQKFGCPERFTHMVRQLHGGMTARVTDNGSHRVGLPGHIRTPPPTKITAVTTASNPTSIIGHLRIQHTETGEAVPEAPRYTLRIRLNCLHYPAKFGYRMGLLGHPHIYGSLNHYMPHLKPILDIQHFPATSTTANSPSSSSSQVTASTMYRTQSCTGLVDHLRTHRVETGEPVSEVPTYTRRLLLG
ncbi:unnamed protein product [Schistocephalus solidus]|uniref:Reverse transcriptase domain-containing protein n=1 Tax=Schistocephalus solidus TaxID=70667 RepID=A0A183T6P4_SCHSO|nr:unnamed protein product [Schistocephalus solidus]